MLQHSTIFFCEMWTCSSKNETEKAYVLGDFLCTKEITSASVQRCGLTLLQCACCSKKSKDWQSVQNRALYGFVRNYNPANNAIIKLGIIFEIFNVTLVKCASFLFQNLSLLKVSLSIFFLYPGLTSCPCLLKNEANLFQGSHCAI